MRRYKQLGQGVSCPAFGYGWSLLETGYYCLPHVPASFGPARPGPTCPAAGLGKGPVASVHGLSSMGRTEPTASVAMHSPVTKFLRNRLLVLPLLHPTRQGAVLCSSPGHVAKTCVYPSIKDHILQHEVRLCCQR